VWVFPDRQAPVPQIFGWVLLVAGSQQQSALSLTLTLFGTPD
jgi:hypothetical protein